MFSGDGVGSGNSHMMSGNDVPDSEDKYYSPATRRRERAEGRDCPSPTTVVNGPIQGASARVPVASLATKYKRLRRIMADPATSSVLSAEELAASRAMKTLSVDERGPTPALRPRGPPHAKRPPRQPRSAESTQPTRRPPMKRHGVRTPPVAARQSYIDQI